MKVAQPRSFIEPLGNEIRNEAKDELPTLDGI